MSIDQPRFLPEKLRRYPHMFPLDIVIWERYLAKNAQFYIGFDYDIKVGSGSAVAPETPANFARMQEILSKYRVDVVGYKKDRIEVMEVKPEASTVAIGQVLSYVDLYKRDFKPTLPVVPVIVTDKEVPDVAYLTKQKGIEYHIV